MSGELHSPNRVVTGSYDVIVNGICTPSLFVEEITIRTSPPKRMVAITNKGPHFEIWAMILEEQQRKGLCLTQYKSVSVHEKYILEAITCSRFIVLSGELELDEKSKKMWPTKAHIRIDNVIVGDVVAYRPEPADHEVIIRATSGHYIEEEIFQAIAGGQSVAVSD
ncbi:MAG: hypothetical protein ACRC8S_11745 [Fimbriiglobus sp.]